MGIPARSIRGFQPRTYSLATDLFLFFIPLTRKLKFRQFWTGQRLWGSLSNVNALYNNQSPNYQFTSLNGKTYMEVGTGWIIFLKYSGVDLVWRLLPSTPIPGNNQHFGAFFSFRLVF